MTLLSYLKLWIAERSLHRISLELLAAHDYSVAIEDEYRNGGYSRDDLIGEILEVREKVKALEEERGYVLGCVAQLKDGEAVT